MTALSRTALQFFWVLFEAAFVPFLISPRPDLEAAHVSHHALLEATAVVYYILNDYTNSRQIRLKLQPTG